MRNALSLVGLCLVLPALSHASEPGAREVFEQRVMPIFKSPNPSSCVQCHLAGVDLKDYILPDHEKTFRSLRDQGLIDLESPEKSKILRLIDMGENDKRSTVSAKARKAEHEAFAAWIQACAADATLRNAPKLDEKERARPAASNEVIRHERKDRVLESFERNVWAMRFRCMNCHTEGTPACDKSVKEFGARVAWVKKAGAEATMDYLLSSKLIDAANPDKSRLLQKPLGEVDHKGGIKFVIGDLGHKAYKTWIEDVATIRGGKLRLAADLPPKETGPLRFGTEIWLKLSETPPAWGDKLLQASVYAWDTKANAWEKTPVAITDRLVGAKAKIWQHTLTLLAEPGSERAKTWKAGKPTLTPGRYLVKVQVDADGTLAKDWKATLGEANNVGQAEFQAQWREGYGGMTSVDARTLKK